MDLKQLAWLYKYELADMHVVYGAAQGKWIRCSKEAISTQSGLFGTHNSHLYLYDNMHGKVTHVYQERFYINSLVGILHNLVRPCILLSLLSRHTYSILPELLIDGPPAVCRRMWFQKD